MGLDIYFNKVKKEKEELGYFRKVNFLIKFFGDIKNRNPIKINKKEVEELLNLCSTVLKYHEENPSDKIVASKVLPTQDGFFFGSTDYDEHYYEDVKNTKEFIENVLLGQFDNLQENECIELYISY